MATHALSSQNPWWIDPQAIDRDLQIGHFNSCPVKWIPRLIYFFDFESDGIYTVRGPRQVGKTTMVKMMIKSILEKGIIGRRVFYWTCDLIQGPKELVEILENYINTTRQLTQERLYIFLDEISAVRDWQRGIKYLFDIGKLNNITVVMTGSHSLDIRRAAERLPGRRGKINGVADKILVPMKFSEYIEIRNKNIKLLLRKLNLLNFEYRKTTIYDLMKGKIPPQINELNLHSETLSSLFEDYLLTGGIISALDYYLRNGFISQDVFSTYVQVTIGDILRWRKRESYLAQLLNRIIETMTTRVSWNRLRRGTDIGHTDTVADYVDVLQSSFVLCALYNLDRSKGEPRYEKEKKLYFLDPFIFHALRSWVFQLSSYDEAIRFLGSNEKGKLVESIVCDHLIRFAFNLNPSDTFDPARNVFYWKGKRREVDFVLKIENDYVPVEVKYQSSIKSSDYNGIFSFTSANSKFQGILITNDHLNIHRDVVAIPAYLLFSII